MARIGEAIGRHRTGKLSCAEAVQLLGLFWANRWQTAARSGAFTSGRRAFWPMARSPEPIPKRW